MKDTSALIDLHSHSTCSDGSFSPTRLFEEAAKRGVHTLALTDHDTMAGLEEAEYAAAKFGVEFVPGVEITCECAGTEVHMLGLGVDRGNTVLGRLCEDVSGRRRKRFFEMVEKLRAIGVPLSTTGVEEDVALARPYLARMLVEQGHTKTYQEAFEKYLKKGRPGYLPNSPVPISEAVDAVHAAGGVAMIAHPGLYRNGDEVVHEAVQAGVDGIECYHSDHDHDTTQHYLARARKLDRLVSGGADFHGPHHKRSVLFGKKGCPADEFQRITDAIKARARV